jgi:hypothetical protein
VLQAWSWPLLTFCCTTPVARLNIIIRISFLLAPARRHIRCHINNTRGWMMRLAGPINARCTQVDPGRIYVIHFRAGQYTFVMALIQFSASQTFYLVFLTLSPHVLPSQRPSRRRWVPLPRRGAGLTMMSLSSPVQRATLLSQGSAALPSIESSFTAR